MQNQSTYTAYAIEYYPIDLSVKQPLDARIVEQCPPSCAIESLHYHNAFELGYCYAGSGFFIVDGKTVAFHAPCAVMIHQNQLHKAQSHATDPSRWVFLSVQIPVFLEEIQPRNLKEVMDVSDHFDAAHCVISEEQDAVLVELIHHIVQEIRDKKEGYVSAVKGLLWTALLRHRRLLQSDEDDNSASSKRRLLVDIGPAIGYISANFTQNLRVEELAALCHLSEAGLRRKFIELLSMSPMDYMHKMRIDTAAALLMTSSLPVLKIGYQVGYNTPSCFNRQFHRFYHLSPTEWRKRQ